MSAAYLFFLHAFAGLGVLVFVLFVVLLGRDLISPPKDAQSETCE